MFTGIIDHCGKITAISHTPNAMQLTLTQQFSNLVLGESICVDGVCLTVTSINHDAITFDLSPETCALTIAKNYCVGTIVNLERAMQFSDRFGGHIVTGHADGFVAVKKIEAQNEYVLCEFFITHPEHQLLLTPKGSICINGVSLTINSVHPDYFSVMLIPHTLSLTNLHTLTSGCVVNIEFDYLAKLVSKNILHYRGLYEPN